MRSESAPSVAMHCPAYLSHQHSEAGVIMPDLHMCAPDSENKHEGESALGGLVSS